MAVCLLESSRADAVKKDEAAKLMAKVPSLRQKIAGKSIPLEVCGAPFTHLSFLYHSRCAIPIRPPRSVPLFEALSFSTITMALWNTDSFPVEICRPQGPQVPITGQSARPSCSRNRLPVPGNSTCTTGGHHGEDVARSTGIVNETPIKRIHERQGEGEVRRGKGRILGRSLFGEILGGRLFEIRGLSGEYLFLSLSYSCAPILRSR